MHALDLATDSSFGAFDSYLRWDSRKIANVFALHKRFVYGVSRDGMGGLTYPTPAAFMSLFSTSLLDEMCSFIFHQSPNHPQYGVKKGFSRWALSSHRPILHRQLQPSI